MGKAKPIVISIGNKEYNFIAADVLPEKETALRLHPQRDRSKVELRIIRYHWA
jgi:hypothetical protein